jgi:hypothetical protein
MILALKTSKIAAHGGNGERARSREKVKKRLLLNGVHIE